MKKPAKPKKVSYELIARDSVVGHPMYTLLDELVYLHHTHLAQARGAASMAAHRRTRRRSGQAYGED